MRALSVRQPYAELILLGIKRIEFRSRPTRIIGERFHLYASAKYAGDFARKQPAWSNDLEPAAAPPWMLELAQGLILRSPDGGPLPTGVIVGSAVIDRVTEGRFGFEWHLRDIERANTLRKPVGHPQPVWFNPF